MVWYTSTLQLLGHRSTLFLLNFALCRLPYAIFTQSAPKVGTGFKQWEMVTKSGSWLQAVGAGHKQLKLVTSSGCWLQSLGAGYKQWDKVKSSGSWSHESGDGRKVAVGYEQWELVKSS